ncbi:MAG TPA: hypothetical protein VFO98_00055 [Marmoricola sp.]|nr:hypothetical protein [Marmoricola sp.]
MLAILAMLLPALLFLPATSQAAPAPTATRISVVDVTTPDVTLPQGAPGSPDIFAVVGHDLTVDVVLEGLVGGQWVQLPASYNKQTVLTLAVATGSTTLDQSRTTSVTVPAGATSATFSGVRFAKAANGVTLEVDGPPARNRNDTALTPGVSGSMDVQADVVTAPGTSTLTSIGPADTKGAGCAATPAQPVCADLLLPNGSVSSQLLSLGACDGVTSATQCPTGRSVVQALADLTGYDRAHPATLVMKCDKDSCGGGSIQGQQLVASKSATGELQTVPACPAKGVVGADQDFCVDYVQSTRDNAGDTLLFLLFPEDGRASFR